MIGKAKRAFSKLTRSLASVPFKFLSANSRAQVLETLSDEMISTTRTPAGAIRFYAPSPLLRFRAASVLSKETDTIQWIDGFEDGTVFWDIGANIGVYCLYAALRKKLTALAFEPAAANFHVLTRNIQLNRLSDRVTAYCLAFSDRGELGVLNLSACAMGGSLNQFGKPGEKSPYATGPQTNTKHGMLGLSIDDFIGQFRPAFPNYVKLDVDGLEMSILRGARNTLSDPRLRSLMVEISITNECERADALQLLADCGWRLASRGESQGTDTERAANHFFERPPDFH